LLAESVVQGFGGRVRFHAENFGDSALARRFGVTRYPAFFVDDILVATPKDFGFFGKGEGPDVARYAPFRSAEGHAHFRADLDRSIRLVLAGQRALAAKEAPSPTTTGLEKLPEFTVTDVNGNELTSASLAGRPVLVEFWATWCPPCRGTLQWLAELQKRHGERLAVVTFAVDSDPAMVTELARASDAVHWAIATPELARSFGDVSALPTLLVFDAQGKAQTAFLGAPPTLHAEIERRIDELLR
jgi:thiol-disulfide isomerase/thioredoxin